jgi:LemA protein
MKRWTMWVGVIAVLALVAGGMYVHPRNEMVRKSERIRQSWSEVDVQLQRRADLIPSMAGTVKGYAQHEKTVFDDVASARAALLTARTPPDRMAANAQMDVGLARLLAIAENYPELKANENFLKLQDELESTENRIAVARLRYNSSLQDYNTYIGVFPHNLVACWAGVQRNNAYFVSSSGADHAPQVDFLPARQATAPH